MRRGTDSGSILVESLIAMLLLGFTVIVVGLVVVSANRSVAGARKHAHAVSLLARYASVAQRVDCAAAPLPTECDAPMGWITTPMVIAGREVSGEIVERGTTYTVEWTDGYEAPLGRQGNVRATREVSVSWTHLGIQVTRSIEVLGPPAANPDDVAWLSWDGAAPVGVYIQTPTGGTPTEIEVHPRVGGGGEWMIALPETVPPTPPRPLTLCTPLPGGGCDTPIGQASLTPGGRCVDDSDPRWTVDICPA